MNSDSLFFSEADIERWVDHHRSLLASNIRRISSTAFHVLAAARMTPTRLLILTARASREPDWNAGFASPCAIVVRDANHHLGRLGAWDENGTLCIESQIGKNLLIAREGVAELHLTNCLPTSVCTAIRGQLMRDTMSSSPLSFDEDARILAAAPSAVTDGTAISFETASRTYYLQQQSTGRQLAQVR